MTIAYALVIIYIYLKLHFGIYTIYLVNIEQHAAFTISLPPTKGNSLTITWLNKKL